MAERRFISKSVLYNPEYCSLPSGARALYSYLVLNADDDGFVDNVKSVQKGCGCYAKSLRNLVKSQYILVFPNGTGVIRHWNLMNKVQGVKYKKTHHTAEKSMLGTDEDGVYYLLDDDENTRRESQSVRPRLGQVSLGKDNNILANYRNKKCDGDDAPQIEAAVYTAEFEELWALYPKKRDKYKAYVAYQKAKKTGVTDDVIKDGINRYNAYIERKQIPEKYIKYGVTFFNHRTWEDDYSVNITRESEAFDEELYNLL